jgi:SNF2 family DNA or RNA helicase
MGTNTNNCAQALPPLWSHQKEAIARATNRYALFFDPGCGKTRTAIELWRLAKPARPAKTIIFAPLNVCRNWENELRTYSGCHYSAYLVAGQSKGKKLQALEDFARVNSDVTSTTAIANTFGLVPTPQFLICNIESLRSADYRNLMARSGATFIIIDESHNLKSPTSQQTKGALSLIATLKPTHLYLLTGTPAPQGEIDLYTTFFMLGKCKENFFVWRKKYFDDKNERRRGMNNYWPEYVVRKSSKEYFQTLLTECSMSAQKDLVLDLPPLLRTTLYAELSPEQKRNYESMAEYLFAIDGEGNELNASNMLVRTLRLQQILAGFLGETPIKENPRLKVLEDAIALTDGAQFLVWTIFKATYSQIAKVLDEHNISFGMLTGEQSAEERFRAMEDFQAGKIRALIAHPKAGGVGVNLTAASYSIHFTRSYSLTDDLQAEARNYRGGSEIHKRITRIDIVAADTIDEEIAEALKGKKSVQDFILNLKEKHNVR